MATIDELSAALVKADAAGNGEDARAFADAIRQMRLASPAGPALSGAARIPTEPGANLVPTVAPPQSFGDKIRGAIETPLAVAANLVAAPVTYLAGVGGPEFQQKVANQIQYQPRTQMAQQAVEGLGSAMEASKLPPFMPAMGLTQSLVPAARAAKDSVGAVARMDIPLGETVAANTARVGQERMLQSVQNAAKIDAATSANQLGIKLNPATSNPNQSNRMRSVIAGNQEVNSNFSKQNAPIINEAVKKDIGIPADQVLDAKAIETALAQHSAPYDVVRQIPVLNSTPEITASLESLRPIRTVGGESTAGAVNKLIDGAIRDTESGLSGTETVTSIRQLRRDGNTVLRSQNSGGNPSPEAVAEANTRLSIANTLEQMIDANVSDPKLIEQIHLSRAAQAKIFDVERATNMATNQIDPMVFAKMVADGKPLSGVPAQVGRIAANFPEIVNTADTSLNGHPRLARTSLGGGVGAAMGGVVGGIPGAAVGAGLGSAAGAFTSKLAISRMGSPAYQAAKTIPKDYRTKNNLRPTDIEIKNALVTERP